MKIVNLIENTEGATGCVCEHGLSFYIETKKHKILLDTGASNQILFNAEILGIDLSEVDTLVLSHGHYDHSGGILAIAEINPQVKVYMQRTAVLDYYHPTPGEDRYIGIDKKILELPGLVLLEGDYRLDEELSIFTNITGRRLWPKGNLSLKCKEEAGFVQDNFNHEQCLVIEAEGQHILLSGCAHNGILNVLDKYQELYHNEPDMVISGFHMMKKTEYREEEIRNIKDTATELTGYRSHFFTGHCTGFPAFHILKEIMGEQLTYVHCGEQVIVRRGM